MPYSNHLKKASRFFPDDIKKSWIKFSQVKFDWINLSLKDLQQANSDNRLLLKKLIQYELHLSILLSHGNNIPDRLANSIQLITAVK